MASSLACTLSSCYSPTRSQAFFVRVSRDDPGMEALYSTSIYTIYYDHALMRCVLHASHIWGQNVGGGGGTGIGVSAFPCDPNRIRARAQGLGVETFQPRINPPVAPVGTRQQRRSQVPQGSTGQRVSPPPALYPQTASPEPPAGQPLN